MRKPKFIFYLAAIVLASFLSAGNLSAQTQTKPQNQPSYEIVLQVLAASNSTIDGSRQAVPQAISGIVKKLKNNYPFSNYRLTETYFQRIADTGSASSNGISNEPNQNADAPVFSEWAIDQFLILPDAKGQDSISIRNFRFGQRVPVKTAVAASNGEKPNAVVNYQQIGLAISRLNLPANTPTVIGNLSAQKSDELMFLILTVKPADEPVVNDK
jgi:hypothetical protein